MEITATELKMNLGKYLDLVNNEDVIVTKNGKAVAMLTQPKQKKLELLSSLVGIARGVEDSNIKDKRLRRQ